MRIKKIFCLLITGIMLTSLSACGKKDSKSTVSTTTQESTKSTGKDIHIASWNNAADNLTTIAKAFNVTHKGSGKVIIDYADSDYSKLKPTLASGSGVPDIFQIQNRDIPAFYNNYGLKSFADISDIVNTDAANWVDFALETCKAKDGKYYSIPWDIGPVALYYRTDVFKAAGIDVSTLTTWDKYIEAGKKIKTKGNYYLEAYNFNGSTCQDEFMIYLNQLGGQYYDKDGKVNLTSEQMIKASNLINKMVNAKVAMDIPNAWDDRIKAINDNKLVAFAYPAWFMGTMKNSCAPTSGKWGIIKMPAFEEGGNSYANAGGSILAVSAKTVNLPLAKEFLSYAMKTNEGNDVNMKFGEFPSYKPAYKTEFFKSKNEYYGGVSVGTIFSKLTGAKATTWGPYFTDVSAGLKTAAGNILANKMDPKTALDAATKAAQNTIDAK
ncbi:ABC transporter substrate-binding protein [Clostridium estertheticum]|uniref:ABC transporter substrate-binding protein n=1 Tax=Clostridium estertheticum TaxID=238834 RepID=UPI001C0CC3A8|nr:extracellular solute-binding protein [Clostridium estertheticum]MBU3186246.1 extracellular solute-binding protein [Clostridium estertheticum]